MLKTWNTIMQINKKSRTSVQRFKRLSLMFVIGIRPMMLKEANGKGIMPWNYLQVNFQNWDFLWKSEFLFQGSCAASCLILVCLTCTCLMQCVWMIVMANKALLWWFGFSHKPPLSHFPFFASFWILALFTPLHEFGRHIMMFQG